MDVIITPQAAADAGCRATSTSQPYSDSVIGSSGHVTFEFNGSFPILYVTRAGRWKLKEIKILTRRDWRNDIGQSGTETLGGYMGDGYTRTYGDRIDFLQFMKDANPDWYPIARHNPIYPSVADGVQNWFFEDGTQYAENTYEIMSMTLVFEESDDILISTSASPADAGTTTGGGLYRPDSSVTIKATPNEGYIFLHWTKNGTIVSNDSTYSFVVSEDATYVAVFEEVSRKFTITTSAFPVDGGVTSGGGRYNRGDPVTIRAVANPGYKFDVWKKGVLVVAGGSGIYAFSAKEDAEYVAYFKPYGIIYDPSSGKIMYDANAGSILCYT